MKESKKMGYAYLDRYGILHIVSSISTVPTGATMVATEITHDGGFPTVRNHGKHKKVYMYSETEAYIGGNRNSFEAVPPKAIKMDFEEYPEILKLYKTCM